ncbi:unnamed protein product [Calypogeia fissa]
MRVWRFRNLSLAAVMVERLWQTEMAILYYITAMNGRFSMAKSFFVVQHYRWPLGPVGLDLAGHADRQKRVFMLWV